ncbi:hypothetical protein BLNAU_16032 [Blattamonas nauphoetae]|uniref:Uncharacterized protein n=1 Tax=Blattamonas nauphoetae TaxID=2049346 RepID=A0ABQ9XEF3_9EUKA|nr:hypothetical protein BLNAU_16032 [Blattamonas nauphoetae]
MNRAELSILRLGQRTRWVDRSSAMNELDALIRQTGGLQEHDFDAFISKATEIMRHIRFNLNVLFIPEELAVSLVSRVFEILESSLLAFSHPLTRIYTPLSNKQATVCFTILRCALIPCRQYLHVLCQTYRKATDRTFVYWFLSLVGRLLRLSPLNEEIARFSRFIPFGYVIPHILVESEDDHTVRDNLVELSSGMAEWKKRDSSTFHVGLIILRDVFSEGFDNCLEMRLMNDGKGGWSSSIQIFSQQTIRGLGGN